MTEQELIRLLLPETSSPEDEARAKALAAAIVKLIEDEAHKAVQLHENAYHGGDY